MLQMVKRLAFICLVCLLLNGCEKYNLISMVIPPSDLVNSRFEQSMRITQGKAVAQIEAADEIGVKTAEELKHIFSKNTTNKSYECLTSNTL